MNAISVEAVSKSFGEVLALQNVTFDVAQGEIFGLVGQNGAGKTTMLRMIMDIFRPDTGRIQVLGQNPNILTNQQIGYLPEERGIYTEQKVSKVLEYFARLKGLSRAAARANLAKWLARFEIEKYADRKIETLSKGNQQKVQVISTLIADPRIVILDEPLSGLDPVNLRFLSEVLREMAAEGKTILFSSHQMPIVERLCKRILMISRGQVALYGSLDEIRGRHGSESLEDIYIRIAKEAV
jgi:ABC-2 type transport system ATP-binding protein